jgi:uncharacterized protein YecE (DUF72 family)
LHDQFPPEGSHLARYAARLTCVEINSSFYRQHKRAVYERWASSVPEDFRFAVKVPRAISHEQRLVASDVLLEVFLDEVRGLGTRLGPLLVQLPPSLAYDDVHAGEFFAALREMHDGPVACEPRHESWFGARASEMLLAHRVARVAADPARTPAAAEPAGWGGLVYYRWHGSPRIYYSDYTPGRLAALARNIVAAGKPDAERWCIFDNTAFGAATGNAIDLARLVSEAPARAGFG